MKRLIVVLSLVTCVFMMSPSTTFAGQFCKADCTGDCKVDLTDLVTMKSEFLNPNCESCSPPYPAPVERTWQSPSYAYGDDGYYHKGVSWGSGRFTINGNGTVTDNLTGIIWLKNANCWGQLTWSQALTYANGLMNGECGLTDGSSPGGWRLPNVKEMTSLIDYDYYDRAMWGWAGFFTNVQSSYYWSSTTFAFETDYIAWSVDLTFGSVQATGKEAIYYVWPVRGGQ